MIVVTTPTGRVGRQVLGRIPDGGKPVRVVARDPSRLDPQTRRRVGASREHSPSAFAQRIARSACW